MRDSGAKQTNGILYQKDAYVWHSHITRIDYMEIVRASYYTTCIGDPAKLTGMKKNIRSVEYLSSGFRGDQDRKGNLVPHVFKKENRSKKTKSVDINITIDALRHTYNDSIDCLFLISGDGDYIPLIQEVMRQGKQVFVGALSDGLNPEIPDIPDKFINLDAWMIG